ncbi:Dyp-type peroxidase [Ningiella sp. W23]|uniref:Dyp-type peroxidase n=1 Tax=Ningiella sp. W23 TaxID=3023715 RepID=UPI003756CCB2
MTQPQKGICAEPNLHAQYLLFNVVDDDMDTVRSKVAACIDIFDHFDEEHYEAMVSGVVAIGSNFFEELYPGEQPRALAPFPDMQSDDRCAPVIPCDLFVQIRADRLDICHAMGIRIMELMRLHTELVEQIRAFRYLDGRDLTGFIITDDNPRGMKKFDISVVGEEDEHFAGGSYIHVQRYRHDMTRWQTLSEKRQEDIIGRTKEHNLPVVDSGLSSHAFRTKITGANGEYPILLNQSMPYGNMSVQGLYFVSCASHPNAFRNLLHSRIYGDQNGHYDRLLDYTNAETGAAFFAPSIPFIRQRALVQEETE